jgi:hypothetical protein
LKFANTAVETGPRDGYVELGDGDLLVDLYAEVNGEREVVLRYGLATQHRSLADRLVKAWRGKAFFRTLALKEFSPSVGRTGEGFLTCGTRGDYAPLGRKLNADLRRLGY